LTVSCRGRATGKRWRAYAAYAVQIGVAAADAHRGHAIDAGRVARFAVRHDPAGDRNRRGAMRRSSRVSTRFRARRGLTPGAGTDRCHRPINYYGGLALDRRSVA
jgi:hypothetical protein